MAMHRYVALITPHAGGYDVVFPDLPGCTSAGDSYEEALSNAVEALGGHTTLMQRDGETVPAPRGLDGVKAAATKGDWDDPTGRLIALIPLIPADDCPAQPVSVNLEPHLLAAIDADAARRGLTRSAYLAAGARRMLLEP